MNGARRLLRVVVVSLVVLAASGVAALEVPYLSGRVVDEAGLLSPEARVALEARLERLDRETGTQMAVLTVPSLEGDSLEDFSMRVVETWKLGRADIDDGVLVLVARDERRIRIEVGYGLEPVIPDILAGRVIREIMQPAFRAGDFDRGITAAVEALAGLVDGSTELPPPPEQSAPTGDMVGGLLVFIVVIGVFTLNALFASGCQSWFLYAFLTPFWFAFPSAFFGTRVGGIVGLCWLIGFPILKLLVRSTGIAERLRQTHPGWTTWTSGGGWSSGGGGFSGGGFSGGGGSFGGGGASGGW